MVDKAHGGAKRASSDASAGRQPGGQKLARVLGVPDMIVYGLIFMVPIAPMGIYGGVFSESGGMPALVYLVGTLAMVFTALSYGMLIREWPARCTPTPRAASAKALVSSRAGRCCSIIC